MDGWWLSWQSSHWSFCYLINNALGSLHVINTTAKS